MRYFLSAIVMILIGLQNSATAADDGQPPTFETEYYYRKVYMTKPGHKAMAVGPSGAFGTSWGNSSSKEAIANAIENCRKGLIALHLKNRADSKCRLAVAESEPLSNDMVSLASWQKPASGNDRPLKFGFKSVLPMRTGRGILLALHGCDGVGWVDYNVAWGKFFNSLGFDFYVPDSFAEQRPPADCGKQNDDEGVYRVSQIFRLRIAQTLRTIEKLRADYPGRPIYLWGHSQGGVIAQAIEGDVAGVIVSGNECGVFELPVALEPKVPILFVLGENDKAVDGVKLPITEKALKKCQKFMGKRKWSASVLKNNGHVIWPWRKTAGKAIAEFIGERWREVLPDQTSDKVTLSNKTKDELEAFGKKPGHKAFAVGSQGAFAWAVEWEYSEDAAQFVLFNCAKQKSIDIFATGRHHCVLVNVDGKAQQ